MNPQVFSSRSAKGARLILGVILLVAFALRLWGLDQHNIWWDEGFTTWMARLPVLRMLDRTAHDTHPPLSYLMQRGWWLLTGEGAWQMRFVSVFASTLTVAVVYAIGRRLGGRRAGLLAALFAALSVFAITWAQEIRMYAWVAAWGVLTLYAALRVWQTPRPGWFLLYVGATAAGLYSLYLSIIVPLVANLAFLVFWWRDGRTLKVFARWALAQVAVVALLAPWLAYALPRMPRWSAAEPYSAGFFARLYATVMATGIGENIDTWLAPASLVLIVALICTVVLIRLHKSALQAGGLALLIFAVVLPPALVYALTAFPGRQPYVPPLSPRYFLPLAAAFSVLLGWGLAELTSPPRPPLLAAARKGGVRRTDGARGALAVTGAGVVAAVAFAGVLAVLPGRVASDDYASLAATLGAHRHAGDRVLLYPDDDWPLFAGGYAGDWAQVPGHMDYTPDSVAGVLAPVWDAAEGVWVVSTPKAQEADPAGLVWAWLDEHAVAKAGWDFGETRLTLYARTPERAANLYDLGGAALPDFAVETEAAGGRLAAPQLRLSRYHIGDTLFAAVYWLEPPSGALSLGLREADSPQEPLSLLPVGQGPQRVVGRLPLTPDLQPGRYTVVLREDGREVADLGSVELVGRRQGDASAQPQHLLDARFGQYIRLLGFDLPQASVGPGEFVELTLYWQTDSVLTERYKVFTHLIGETWNADGGNFLWGQQDNEPQADGLPTTRWPPDEAIVDHYRIKIAPNAPAGVYQIEVGMYGLLEGVRLPISSGGDSLVLGWVQVR